MNKERSAGGGWMRIKEEAKRHPVLTAVYVVLRLTVAVMLLRNLWQGEYESAFICGLALVLFFLPAAMERYLRIDIPSVMEVMMLLFIFGAEILGELQNYYHQYPYWDTMLHTVNGFLCAAFGFSLVDILSRNRQEKFRLSPLYLSLVAFCFSMTVGVLWEFFEFGMDYFFRTDMQKDTVLTSIASVAVNPNGGMTLLDDLSEMTLNGQPLGVEGYLDIGLYDTMADLFVNFVGAVVFSTLGYFYLRRSGKGKAGRFLRHFMPYPVEMGQTVPSAPSDPPDGTPDPLQGENPL